jgi:hypothetical protein
VVVEANNEFSNLGLFANTLTHKFSCHHQSIEVNHVMSAIFSKKVVNNRVAAFSSGTSIQFSSISYRYESSAQVHHSFCNAISMAMF